MRGAAPPSRAGAAAWAAVVLAGQEAAGLLRTPRQRAGGSGPRAVVAGRPVVVLSSNDYLGLAADPRVRRAAADAALALGTGATGSRHLGGCHEEIAALEAEPCAFEGAPTATLAPSGYQANVAVLQALGGPDAVVLSDERNHASIIDGCRLSRAEVEVYRHADLDDLDDRLRRSRRRPVVVSDTVFSMHGDVAGVAGLLGLARRHDAWLVLDEAHATGVLGPGGRGAAAEAGLHPGDDERLVRMVTLSKALGAAGGAVLGSPTLRQLLLQRGRALVFSTAPAPAAVAAARAALAVLAAEPERPGRVRALARRLRTGLRPLATGGRPDVPIVPLVVGDAARAVALEASLLQAGYLAQAVRPPTVPPGTSRVRLVPTAAHTEAEVDGAAAAVLAALESSA